MIAPDERDARYEEMPRFSMMTKNRVWLLCDLITLITLITLIILVIVLMSQQLGTTEILESETMPAMLRLPAPFCHLKPPTACNN